MRTRLLPLLVLLALPTLLPETAHADRRNPLEGQPAVRRRLLLRKLRFEVTPQFVTSINQDYKHAFGPGINLQFHLTDWLAIGVQGVYTLNANTGLEDKVRGALQNVGPYNMRPDPQPTLQMHDEHVMGIQAVFSAYAQVTPFYGKIAFFSALFVNYDLYVNGGIGFVDYTSKCCTTVNVAGKPGYDPKADDPNTQNGHFDGLKIGGQIGVGAHIYFNEWFGLQFELRDYIVGANPGGLDTNGDRKLNSGDEGPQNNIFFGVGLTFMLPPTARQS
ncbi:MAG: outer membrane beta-barrel domain-containing protein, partial [Polyangia bacterium]